MEDLLELARGIPSDVHWSFWWKILLSVQSLGQLFCSLVCAGISFSVLVHCLSLSMTWVCVLVEASNKAGTSAAKVDHMARIEKGNNLRAPKRQIFWQFRRSNEATTTSLCEWKCVRQFATCKVCGCLSGFWGNHGEECFGFSFLFL